MDERLLIEATEELLDGWCGPGLVRWADGELEPAEIRSRNGVPELWSDDLCDWHEVADLEDREAEPARILLDLSRAECRDRVARVVADTPLFNFSRDHTMHRVDFVNRSGRVAGWCHQSYRSYALTRPGQHSGATAPGARALAALNPNDDTRLPDGSRLVDALALAAVWREVANG